MVGNAVWPNDTQPDIPQRPHSRTPAARSPQISIVIAARNNAVYLAETIESAFNQSISCEVIYADDCSFDNSVSVAQKYKKQGLIITESSWHAGVCETRNRGAEIARGDYLLFLDGDDILPPDYVQQHLDKMTCNTPFAYGAAEAFGDYSTLWNAPEWTEGQLWLRNFVNTSALWNRQAFETAGRWRNKINTMWDWDLALRGSRLGTPVRSTAVLKYRQHANSWSANIQTKYQKRQEILLPQMRRICSRLSIGSIISGRLPDFFPQWLSAVSQSVNLINSEEPVELVLFDNSNNVDTLCKIRAETSRYINTFETIRIVSHPDTFSYKNEKERRDKTARFMALACNRLRNEMRGDIHWLIEDDILVPLEAGVNLMTELTADRIPPNAVSGCYRNRHNESQLVGGHFDDYHIVKAFTDMGDKICSVDYCGTGCLMYWKDRTPRYWNSHYKNAPAHDWEWCSRLKSANGVIRMLPSVHCGHAKSPSEIIY